ncbi:MAG: glycosyltransferase [Ruminococcaceae bacterium]|nr:glycosyltransferase [Oscillospiraceae bacterium]
MLISYLVPVYNVEKYIRQCLDSILSQSGAEFEVLLLDDGSTDSSGTICDEYARAYPNIVRVIHKENEGVLKNRCRGFVMAKGDWYVSVDPDDCIKENHLQTIVAAIEQYDCDMLMFDYESFYPDGRTEPSGIDIQDIQIYENGGKQDIYKKRLLKNKYNNMWTKAIKRSVVDFETDYDALGVKNMCDDAILSYELYTRAKRIVFIPDVLYSYRRSIVSITSNVNMDYWHAVRVCIELGWKYVKLWNVPENVAQAYGARCVSDYCNFLGWLLMKSGLDEEQKKEIFREVFLENKWFDMAVKQYKKEYLATRYIKLRDPMIVKSILSYRSYDAAKAIFRIEKVLRGQ